MKKGLKYFLLAILFWILVDFTTTAAIADLSYYAIYMPALLIFYIGYPLIFSLLIYKFKIKTKGLFIAMLIGILLIEIVLSGNVLFFAFPLLLLVIPLALAYYAIVTFLPLWIVEKRFKENKKWLIAMLILWVIGSLLNLVTQLQA